MIRFIHSLVHSFPSDFSKWVVSFLFRLLSVVLSLLVSHFGWLNARKSRFIETTIHWLNARKPRFIEPGSWLEGDSCGALQIICNGGPVEGGVPAERCRSSAMVVLRPGGPEMARWCGGSVLDLFRLEFNCYIISKTKSGLFCDLAERLVPGR